MIASSLKIEGLYEFDHVDHRRRAMSAPPPLLIERRGAVAILTLNRPDVGNAIDSPTAKILMETAITCDEDEPVLDDTFAWVAMLAHLLWRGMESGLSLTR